MHSPVTILYEDNHLLAVEKRPGQLSQSDGIATHQDLDLGNRLKAWLKWRDQKPGQVFLAAIHRLDRPVGGVMLFAKTSKAASRLSEQMRSGKIKKVYLAVACGKFAASNGHLEHYLLKDKRQNLVRVYDVDDANRPEAAKYAELDYQLLEKRQVDNQLYSQLQIQLKTGRSHQIRSQLAKIGHPICGDHKYAQPLSGMTYADPALWSYQYGFEHPTKHHWLEITCEPPKVKPWSYFSEVKHDL